MDEDFRARLEPLYRATDYCVEDVRLRCTLRVDEPCPALSAWLESWCYVSAAFITACNPRSETRPEAENREALAQLRSAVKARALPALSAVGRAQVGDHREPSLLVPGLPLEDAHVLMREFEQNAFVWFDRTVGRARLEWLQSVRAQ